MVKGPWLWAMPYDTMTVAYIRRYFWAAKVFRRCTDNLVESIEAFSTYSDCIISCYKNSVYNIQDFIGIFKYLSNEKQSVLSPCSDFSFFLFV